VWEKLTFGLPELTQAREKTRMPESDVRTDEPTSGCVGIALLGAILLSCVGTLAAFLEVVISAYPPAGSQSAHEHFAYNIFFGSLAFAWVPVGLAYRLSNRGRMVWAYLVAFIPAALTPVFVIFLRPRL
jgi:hypothetical protein